jgi:hypothetical protein
MVERHLESQCNLAFSLAELTWCHASPEGLSLSPAYAAHTIKGASVHVSLLGRLVQALENACRSGGSRAVHGSNALSACRRACPCHDRIMKVLYTRHTGRPRANTLAHVAGVH